MVQFIPLNRVSWSAHDRMVTPEVSRHVFESGGLDGKRYEDATVSVM